MATISPRGNPTQPITNQYKVKLVDSTAKNTKVIFHVTPDLVESRNVNYKTIEPVHAPGQMYAYGTSASRVFNLSNVRLVSRNMEEAERNVIDLWLLRSWCMPFFGKGSLSDEQQGVRDRQQQAGVRINDPQNITNLTRNQRTGELPATFGVERRGEPPKVLLFSAYSLDGDAGKKRGHINKVPVVIQQLTIQYPSDIDYITTKQRVPMATIMTIDMTLTEAHAAVEYESFSLSAFRNGVLRGF